MCSSSATSWPSPLSFPCTSLLLSLFGAMEPAGCPVARGVGSWGWSLRRREVTHLPVPTQELFSLPRPCQCLRCNRKARICQGAAPEAQHKAGQQPGVSFTSGHNQAIDFPSQELLSFVLIQCEKNPFEGCSSPVSLSYPSSVVLQLCLSRLLLTWPCPLHLDMQEYSVPGPAEAPAPGDAQCGAGPGAVTNGRLSPHTSQHTAVLLC